MNCPYNFEHCGFYKNNECIGNDKIRKNCTLIVELPIEFKRKRKKKKKK
jgi:hypothetical protein